MKRLRQWLWARRIWLLEVALVTPAGFLLKEFGGPPGSWLRNSLTGAMYVVFWCLVGRVMCMRARTAWIVLIVLLATCALETLQLWNPPLLHAIRQNYLGRTLIGTTFVWSDFAWYLLGSAAGWRLIRIRGGETATGAGSPY